MMMIMMMRDLVLIQSVYVSWCGDGEYANLYERNAWSERWKKSGEEELKVFACLMEIKVYEIVVGEIVVCNLRTIGILGKRGTSSELYMTDVWKMYECTICAFPEYTFCRKVFVMAVHNPQSTISF